MTKHFTIQEWAAASGVRVTDCSDCPFQHASELRSLPGHPVVVTRYRCLLSERYMPSLPAEPPAWCELRRRSITVELEG